MVACVFSFMVGAFETAVLSPIYATAFQNDSFYNHHLRSLHDLPPKQYSNIWLRNIEGDQQSVVRVGGWQPSTGQMLDVKTFTVENKSKAVTVETDPVILIGGPTGLQTIRVLESSVALVETVGFWRLSRVLVQRDQLGLDTKAYQLKWQTLLFQPLLLGGLGLLGAGLVLRLGSRVSSRKPMVMAVMLGLLILFLRKYLELQATLHGLPHTVAVIFPVIFCFLLACYMLLAPDRA